MLSNWLKFQISSNQRPHNYVMKLLHGRNVHYMTSKTFVGYFVHRKSEMDITAGQF